MEPLLYRRRQLLCTLTSPPPDSARVYSDKIRSIVNDISGLTLKETAQLNEMLKVTKNNNVISVGGACLFRKFCKKQQYFANFFACCYATYKVTCKF